MKNFLIIFLLFGLIALSACGKMSAPEPYKDSGYPHTYPKR